MAGTMGRRGFHLLLVRLRMSTETNNVGRCRLRRSSSKPSRLLEVMTLLLVLKHKRASSDLITNCHNYFKICVKP